MISKCQKFRPLNSLLPIIVILCHIHNVLGFSTQTGPLLKDLLNGGDLILNLEDFRPSLSVSLYSEELPATNRINGKIVVRGGTGRGIILVIQKLDLRVKYNPQDPCRDYVMVKMNKSGAETKNCGFLDSKDYKEGTMYGNRTFISQIDEEIEIDIRTDENRGEEMNPKYNVIHIILTSYARCNTSENENSKNQSSKKNFTADYPCSDLSDYSDLCIRSGLFCDGFFNCPDLRFSFYQAVILWKKSGYMSSDEFNCKQPEEKKKVFWTSLDSTKSKNSEEVTLNNSSRSTTEPDILYKKTGGRTVNDLAQLLIIVGVFALVVTIAFVACTWLGRSEAGKLMRTYGIREGLRQSFRRSRRNFPKPNSNLERSSSRTEIATGGPAPKIVSENRRKKRAPLGESLENEAIKASLEGDAKEIKELEVAAASRIPTERSVGFPNEEVGLPPPPPYSSLHVPQRRSEEKKRHHDKSSMV